jgi:hypothetical protein
MCTGLAAHGGARFIDWALREAVDTATLHTLDIRACRGAVAAEPARRARCGAVGVSAALAQLQVLFNDIHFVLRLDRWSDALRSARRERAHEQRYHYCD